MEGARSLSAQRALPLLRLALLVLIACGGCSSGGEPSSTRRIRLAVKTDIADQRLSRRSLASAAAAQPRQVGRGDPGPTRFVRGRALQRATGDGACSPLGAVERSHL